MKQILYSLMLGSLISFSSCESKMDEKHNNSDGFTNTKIEYLFTKGADKTIGNDYADHYTYVFRLLGIYTQTTAMREGKDRTNTYDVKDDKTRWDNYFLTRMNTLTEIDKIYATLSASDQSSYRVYIEAGKILKAFNTAMATDFFGAMPYSEAFTARNPLYGGTVILRPKYDTQQEIYYALLADLETAAAYFKTATLNDKDPIQNTFSNQDILFAGKLNNWFKFANSLRLRYAMRISNVDEAKAKEVLTKLNLDELITSANDNAVIRLTSASYATDGIWRAMKESQNKGSGYTFAPELMVNLLKEAGDLRLKLFFQPASDDDGKVFDLNQEIIGYPASADDAITLLNSDKKDEIANTYGIYNTTTYRNNYSLPYGVGITSADVWFLLAEAYQRKLVSGDAETAYNKGIVESIQTYHDYYANATGEQALVKDENIVKADVSEGALLTWLAGSTFKFDSSKALEQIATQKWMNMNILEPYENWAEYRRTDLPVLLDDKANRIVLNGENAPKRFLYSTKEASMNTENYNKQSEQNRINIRLWWDVK